MVKQAPWKCDGNCHFLRRVLPQSLIFACWVNLVCIITPATGYLLGRLHCFELFQSRSATMPITKGQEAKLSASSKRLAKECEQSAQDSQSSAPLNVATFTDQLSTLKTDLFGKIESVVGSLRTEISSVREELTSTTCAMRATLDSHANRLVEIENTAVFCGDSVRDLHTTVNTLTSEVSSLKAKCEELESRSRRNNIRVVGLKEGAEGPQSASWLAKWLQDTLDLSFEPAIDRAHRALRPKPRNGEAPRPVILRLLYQRDRAVLLRKARERGNSLQYDGRRVHIFPDLTAAQFKKREEFTAVKRLLRENPAVKDYGFFYPGHLRITLLNGEQHRFDDPAAAERFIQQHPSTQESPAEPDDNVASNDRAEMD